MLKTEKTHYRAFLMNHSKPIFVQPVQLHWSGLFD